MYKFSINNRGTSQEVFKVTIEVEEGVLVQFVGWDSLNKKWTCSDKPLEKYCNKFKRDLLIHVLEHQLENTYRGAEAPIKLKNVLDARRNSRVL